MNYIKNYVDFLEKYLSLEAPVKAVFDCSNGTTGKVLKEVVERNDLLKAHFINDEEDGTFPAHNPGPLVEGAMDDLMKTTPKENADIGVIFDPDGDRVFFVDEKGETIPGFGVDDCIYINTNSVDHTAEWLEKGSDVSSLVGRTVKLVVRMRGTDLYAFQFKEL